MKSVQILFEGDYSGILKPDLHYIPLKKDFSNISDVISKVKNNDLLQAIADRAYEDIITSNKYSYETFIKQKVDQILAEEFEKKPGMLRPNSDYSKELFISELAKIKSHQREANLFYEWKHMKHFYGSKTAFLFIGRVLIYTPAYRVFVFLRKIYRYFINWQKER